MEEIKTQTGRFSKVISFHLLNYSAAKEQPATGTRSVVSAVTLVFADDDDNGVDCSSSFPSDDCGGDKVHFLLSCHYMTLIENVFVFLTDDMQARLLNLCSTAELDENL